MATLTIRNFDDRNKSQLRLQTACHGRSIEGEAHAILRLAVSGSQLHPPQEGVSSRIYAHFARLGGLELELPGRADPPHATHPGEVGG